VTLKASDHLAHLSTAADVAGLHLDQIITPAEGHLAGSGVRIHFLDWGTAGRPTIVFLHGGSLTAHTWDLVCLALRRDYRCVALDLRGHGDSGWSAEADYTLDAHRADVEAVVEQLQLAQFILVGMSLGGLTSLAYAGRHADKLAALVLVDIGPDSRPAGRQRIASFVTADRELDSIEDFVERAMAFNPLRRPELLRRSLQHNLRRTSSGKWTWKYDPQLHAGRSGEEVARRRLQLWEDVPRISCPTLVVRGGNSDVFYDQDAEKLAATLPQGSWVRIAGAGHSVQGDQPKALVDALRAFLPRQTLT
jgi:pimeloyl-ACP methyl ester carboxylesterase